MSRDQIESVSRAGASWYPAGEDRLVAVMLGRVKIVLDRRDFSLTPHIVMSGYWESWVTAWFVRNLTSSDRLLNIGANCGYYALTAAGSGCEVVAVEPQLNLVENLRLSASINGFSKLRVEQCVAGVKERDVELQLYSDFHGSAHVKSVDGSSPLASGTTLVTERPAHELMPNATCVFVDAEGYEPYIWDGLKPLLDKKQLRWVALEWSPTRYDNPQVFLGSLREYGDLSVVNDKGIALQVSDIQLLDGVELDTLVVRLRE